MLAVENFVVICCCNVYFFFISFFPDDLLLQEDLVQMVPMVNESNAMAEELGKQVTTRTIFEIVFVGLLSDKER